MSSKVYYVDELNNNTYKIVLDDGTVVDKEFQSIGNSVWKDTGLSEHPMFTNPDLYRYVDPKLPEDNKELIPRSYTASIQKLNSFMTIGINTHVDYDEVESFIETLREQGASQEYIDKILERINLQEEREIP